VSTSANTEKRGLGVHDLCTTCVVHGDYVKTLLVDSTLVAFGELIWFCTDLFVNSIS